MRPGVNFAAIAAVGLLSLAACSGGGDGEMSETPMPPDDDGDMTGAPMPPDDDDDTVEPPEPEDEIGKLLGGIDRQLVDRMTIALPSFGGITHSSSRDDDGLSADVASATFDGSDVVLTIARADASPLVFRPSPESTEVMDGISPIPDHSRAQEWIFADATDDRIAVATAAVSWADDDVTDYLAIGYWIHVGVDLENLSIGELEMGVFADGPELSLNPPPTMPVQGTATYGGPSRGTYGFLYGTETEDFGIPADSFESGEFHSIAALTADFGADTIEGCVGCGMGVYVSGTFTDADTGEEREFYGVPSPINVQLGPATIGNDGTFRNHAVILEHATVTSVSTSGAWGGQFSNRPDASGDPRLVAGSFAGQASTEGGSELGFVGLFVGTKQ